MPDTIPSTPQGKPDDRNRDAWLLLAVIVAADIAAAEVFWKENLPEEYADYEGILSGSDQWKWSDETQWYSERGRSARTIGGPHGPSIKEVSVALTHAVADSFATDAGKMAAGDIAVDQWQRDFAAQMKSLYIAMGALACGGFSNLTPKIQSTITGSPAVAPSLAFSLDHLRDFAEEITEEPPTVVAIESRAELYANAANGIFEVVRRESHAGAKDGDGNPLFLFERNVLGSEDPCSDTGNTEGCGPLTEAGWQPIGSMPLPGTRTCRMNCECSLEYSATANEVVEKSGVAKYQSKQPPDGYRWKGENCPHCGATLECGDDGKCNQCRKPWPVEKIKGFPMELMFKTMGPHQFSCVMADIPEPDAKEIVAFGKTIPDADLAEDGRETIPHVTIKYGLHTDDAAEIRKVFNGEPPITLTLGQIEIFEANDKRPSDVIVVGVTSPDLVRLNVKVSAALDHTDTYPDYVPHLTIAYVKPGIGSQYAGSDVFVGRKIQIDRLVFQNTDDERSKIKLGQDPEFLRGKQMTTKSNDHGSFRPGKTPKPPADWVDPFKSFRTVMLRNKKMNMVEHAGTGYRMAEETARYIDRITKGLPKECTYRRRFTKSMDAPDLGEMDGYKTDVSLITTDDVDWDGEVLFAEGGDLSEFKRSPTVLFNHEETLPIGISLWQKVVPTATGSGVSAKTRYQRKPKEWEGPWMPDAIHSGIQEGIGTGKSIGFVPTLVRSFTREELDRRPEWKKAAHAVAKWIMVEYSVAPLAANQRALTTLVSKGLAAQNFIPLLTAGSTLMVKKYKHLDFSAPTPVRNACKDGLRRHQAGETKGMAEPETVAMAQHISSGGDASPEYCRKCMDYFEKNMHHVTAPVGTPAYAIARLHGGAEGAAWHQKMCKDLDAADTGYVTAVDQNSMQTKAIDPPAAGTAADESALADVAITPEEEVDIPGCPMCKTADNVEVKAMDPEPEDAGNQMYACSMCGKEFAGKDGHVGEDHGIQTKKKKEEPAKESPKKTLHEAGVTAAKRAIDTGKIDAGDTWEAPAESERKQDECLGSDSSYPVFRGDKVSLAGLRAAASRGGQNEPEIGKAASELLALANDKMKKKTFPNAAGIKHVKSLVEAGEVTNERFDVPTELDANLCLGLTDGKPSHPVGSTGVVHRKALEMFAAEAPDDEIKAAAGEMAAAASEYLKKSGGMRRKSFDAAVEREIESRQDRIVTKAYEKAEDLLLLELGRP